MPNGPRRSAAPPATESMEEIAERVRALVRNLAPELRVETKWGTPWYVGTDLVLAVGAFTRHVGVEFWRGSTVSDPDHLLEGTGKNLRHVKVRSAEAVRAPAFGRLVRAAVALDRTAPKRTR